MFDAEALLRSLQAVGMSGYEAKAYLTLVGAGRPLNGYEVAKRSSVPRSTVYETLGKLLARGAAFEVRSDDDSTGYVALPPDALVRRLRDSFEDHLDRLSESLPQATEPHAGHVQHNLEGRDAVLARAFDLIGLAQDNLFVSAWAEELVDLTAPLDDADHRGVEVSVLRFGDDGPQVGHTYPHVFSAPEVVFDRVGCRLLIVAADHAAVLIGGSVEQWMWGAYSDDPALVLVAIEFVRHDIAFQVLVERLGVAEVAEMFQTDATLLRLATGRSAPGLERRSAPA